jgi:hypothetical protein
MAWKPREKTPEEKAKEDREHKARTAFWDTIKKHGIDHFKKQGLSHRDIQAKVTADEMAKRRVSNAAHNIRVAKGEKK